MSDEDEDRLDEIETDEDDVVELSEGMKAAIKAAEPEEDDDDDDSDADEGDEDDSEPESEAEPDEDSADEEPAPKKGKKDARERIKELARKRRDAEKAAFELEMKNIELERRLAEARPAAKTELQAPNPKDYDYGAVDPKYLDAVVDYKVALREQEIRAEADTKAREADTARIVETYNKKLAKTMETGKARYADFEEVVNSTTYPAELAVMILDSDNPVDIAYHLSNNISELRALARADAAERARVIGCLEGLFSATSAAKKVTKAPEPLGSRASKAKPKSEARYGPDNQDDFDKAFYGRS